jgi:hypothetical protein
MLQVVGIIMAPWRRPARLRGGLAENEAGRTLPGDELIPEPTWQYTHAVDVGAPSDQVWPWIAQVGQGRGGFYSF